MCETENIHTFNGSEVWAARASLLSMNRGEVCSVPKSGGKGEG